MNHSRLLLFCLTLCVWNSFASAAEKPHTRISLVSEVSSIRASKPFTVGLVMEMDPHWHTYWVNPGDSGLATKIDWQLPEGFSAGEIQWPVPKRISLSGLTSFGFENRAVLLTVITPPKNLTVGKSLTLRAKASWLECTDICVPGKGEATLSLKVGAEEKFDSKGALVISEARAALPVPLPPESVRAQRDDKNLKVDVRQSAPFREAFFYPEQEGYIQNAGEQKVQKTKDGFSLLVPLAYDASEHPAEVAGVIALTLEDGRKASYFLRSPIIQTPAVSLGKSGVQAASSLPLYLLWAFVGGLILNLMPCVFPVISLKVLGFVQLAGEDRRKVAWHGGMFALGVVVSFLVLAGVLITLRTAGEQLGWGFQFQNPKFTFLMALLMFAVGLNLIGVFEIGSSLTSLGSSERKGLFSSFLSGVLATAIATPCTGPFMATAIGFALSQSLIASLLIFGAVGLGMAAPYVVLSFFPGLLKFLPRPGAWMETFKQVMSFPMFAAAIWLVWLLAGQTGELGVLFILSAFLSLSISGWVYGKWAQPHLPAGTRAWGIAFTLLFLGGALWPIAHLADLVAGKKQSVENVSQGEWIPFSSGKLAELRSKEKPSSSILPPNGVSPVRRIN